MRGSTRRGALALATAGLLASCTSGSDAPASSASREASPSAVRATPTAISTAGDIFGAPIDLSAMTGRIVFAGGTDDIWSIDANGSDLKRLTTNPANDFDPTLSPDGTRIAFRSDRDGNDEIYVMDVDGGHQHNISDHPAADWGPTWTPDGRVGWNCARNLVAGFHACVANPDGSGLQVLPVHRYFEYPSWSPDGSEIAFMSQQAGAHGNDPNYDVFVVNMDGSDLRQLTDAPGEDGFPSWSPDGTRIAFSSTADDCSNSDAADCRTTGDIGPYETIYVMNADGSDLHRLSLQLGMFVDWSPDGRYLLVSPGLFVIRPDGTGLIRIPVAVDAQFADWGR